MVGPYNLLFFNACSLLAELNGFSQTKTRAVLKSELKRKLYEWGWKGEEALRAGPGSGLEVGNSCFTQRYNVCFWF
jgi:hypothetical protein